MRSQKDASKNCHIGVKYLCDPTFVDPDDSGGSSGRNIIPNELTNNRVILAGNYLFQRLYSWQPVLNAGIISVVTGVWIVNIGGLIIEHKSPNILMATGLMLVIVGATITVYARSQL